MFVRARHIRTFWDHVKLIRENKALLRRAVECSTHSTPEGKRETLRYLAALPVKDVSASRRNVAALARLEEGTVQDVLLGNKELLEGYTMR